MGHRLQDELSIGGAGGVGRGAAGGGGHAGRATHGAGSGWRAGGKTSQPTGQVTPATCFGWNHELRMVFTLLKG